MAGGPTGFVVDASVSAAWFLPDEANPATEATLQATATLDVWVPTVWLLEIGNLLLSAQRRKRITAEKRRELAAAAGALRIRVDMTSEMSGALFALGLGGLPLGDAATDLGWLVEIAQQRKPHSALVHCLCSAP